jgi:hypothetical protein
MKIMTASQMYKQRLRDLVAFGAILMAMGVVAVVTDRIYAAPKDGQVVRKEIAQPKDGHSFTPVPSASQKAGINDSDWPDPTITYLTKHKPVAF